jgi:hypothetical protein
LGSFEDITSVEGDEEITWHTENNKPVLQIILVIIFILLADWSFNNTHRATSLYQVSHLLLLLPLLLVLVFLLLLANLFLLPLSSLRVFEFISPRSKLQWLMLLRFQWLYAVLVMY